MYTARKYNIILILLCYMQNINALDYFGNSKQYTTIPDVIPIGTSNIYLNENKISSIDGNDFRSMPALKQVHLVNNLISYVSEDSFDGSPIEHLDLSGNPSLKTIPNIKYLKSSMTTMTLNSCFLNMTSKTVFIYDKLEYLSLNYNRVTALPDITRMNKTLKTLSIRHSKIPEIPVNYFRGFAKLEVLNLGYNNIAEIVDFTFKDLQSLKTLNLERNRILITIQPNALNGLTMIENLAFYICQSLQTFPVIKEYSNLKHLTVSHSRKIVMIPENVANFSHLVGLHLLRNGITEIPKELFKHMKYLKHVQLQGNLISCLEHETLNQIKTVEILKLGENPLEHFSVSNCNASNPVEETLGLPRILILYLSKCKLTKVPDVSLMPKLSHLYLSENELSGVPSGRFINNSLVELALSGNKIGIFPDLNRACSSLTILQIQNNKIMSIPGGHLKECTKLEKLRLEHNMISSVSPFSELGNCLKELHLSANRITSINSTDFQNLTSIHTLHLDSNQISKFHARVFENLQSLVALNLSSNNLTTLESPYKWCSELTCRDLQITLKTNPIVCDSNLCWAKRYPSLISLSVENCLGEPWTTVTLADLACGEVFEMKATSWTTSTVVFEPQPPPRSKKMLFSYLPSETYCAFWCVENGCSGFKHVPFDRASQTGECIIYL